MMKLGHRSEGIDEVRRRTNYLDNTLTEIPRRSDLLESVVDLMGKVTDGYIAGTYGTPLLVAPLATDMIVESCAAVSHLASTLRSLITGPLDREAQEWTVASTTPLVSSPRQAELSKTYFKDTASWQNTPQTKPARGGLFTSTRVKGTGKSMWHMYLESYGGTLFPKPWHTYQLKLLKNVRILEVSSAVRWANLAEKYPIESGGLMFPDWNRLRQDYDCVHMTIPAIIATQGLRIIGNNGIIAETYWDVESTLWLNWCFDL
jgi:hypothetical protein